MKALVKATAIMLVTLVVGFYVGRSYTIKQAELLEVSDEGYFINFGDEVHEYIFEEVNE